MKLDFTETEANQSYVAACCDLVVYLIDRETKRPNNWIAYDESGVEVDRDAHRHDLFERLQLHWKNQ